MWRKALAFYGAVALVLGLFLIGNSAVRPQIALAAHCTYSTLEHSQTATKAFYSPALGYNNTLHVQIQTWDGDYFSGYQCSVYRQYRSLQWLSFSESGYFYTSVRVWNCGIYENTWNSASSSVWSGEIHYLTGCGRQADNQGSYFHATDIGSNISQYVNQG